MTEETKQALRDLSANIQKDLNARMNDQRCPEYAKAEFRNALRTIELMTESMVNPSLKEKEDWSDWNN